MSSGVRLSACGSGDATPSELGSPVRPPDEPQCEPNPRASSGVAWIDRKVGEIRGARAHLEGLGMAPTRVNGGGNDARYAAPAGWKLPYWLGVFSDDQLIAMARERGFGG